MITFMHKGRRNCKSSRRMEWWLTVGLLANNLGHLSTSKTSNLIINWGNLLWFISLKHKELFIDKMIPLTLLSQSYTTSSLAIGVMLQVSSVFIKPVTLSVFPVCDVMQSCLPITGDSAWPSNSVTDSLLLYYYSYRTRCFWTREINSGVISPCWFWSGIDVTDQT